MRPITLIRQLAAADPNGIAEDQTTVGAGDLVLDGALVVDGVAILDVSRQIVLESAGNLSAITFTITGTDSNDRVVSESIAGPNAATVATVRDDWKTVTQISVSAAVGTNVEVGTNAVGGSQPIPLDQYQTPFNVTLAALITGTVNVTAQFTFDDVFDEDDAGPYSWVNHGDITNAVANANGTLISPVSAVRLLNNSGDGSTEFRVIQAGAQ